jgi:hypothetical protein
MIKVKGNDPETVPAAVIALFDHRPYLRVVQSRHAACGELISVRPSQGIRVR